MVCNLGFFFVQFDLAERFEHRKYFANWKFIKITGAQFTKLPN